MRYCLHPAVSVICFSASGFFALALEEIVQACDLEEFQIKVNKSIRSGVPLATMVTGFWLCYRV